MKSSAIIIGIAVILSLTSCTSNPNLVTPTATNASIIIPTTEGSTTDNPTSPSKYTQTIIPVPSQTVSAPSTQKPQVNEIATAISSSSPPALQPTLTGLNEPSDSPTSAPLEDPDTWQDLPVIPEISERVLQIYQHGLELGNNPQAFSKIGDCGSTPAWFLGAFDRGPSDYSLGDYAYLQDVIDYFRGSFDRTSLAARSGFNASALFVPLWADRTYCQSDESPLNCEYRLQRPIIAFIMLGANDVWHPEEFEPQMRKLIENSLENGVIPILATKADNQEGDGSINATIARLALEYEVPLWNFWRAVNDLPNNGLQEDRVHLTWGANSFDRPESLQLAWPVRNLTALQVLDAVWRKITNQ